MMEQMAVDFPDAVVYALVVVGAVATYKVYTMFAVPKELEFAPTISLWGSLLSLLWGESFEVRFENEVRPVLEKTGVARFWMQGKWDLVISDVQDVKEILAKNDVFLKRHKEDSNLKVMLGRKIMGYTNILNSDGEEWRRHRRVANPAFRKAFSISVFNGCTQQLVELLCAEESRPQEVHTLFRHLTLDILGKGLFSHDFEAIAKGNESNDLKLYNEVMKALFNPLYFFFPFLERWVPSRKRSLEKGMEFRAFLRNIVQKRKQDLTLDHDDLLSAFIKESMQEGTFSDDDVINDLGVFFIAGHDTTANTLTTTFYYLSKHQDVQEKARAEVLRVLKGKDQPPTYDELKEMTYIDCIIKESMRIVSTVAQLRRYCPKGEVLSSGFTIPKNTFVNLQMWMIHHDPKIFPEPYIFRPERFADAFGQQDAQWLAFGSGARMCIGKSFSLMEQRVVIARLVQKFTFDFAPGSSTKPGPELSPSGLIHPVGVKIAFKRIEE
ncbi:hypothetical protein DSO57_1029260 [Entomophthora muscae]|uniref:Uncharacterized protein n=1 Tax=Entomophthora muscae TaxID=34485 RepID=A0ACC2TNI2_9FUNG|nr:hypothetical protein DSO57_1029260 [Entomophthora muscae]